MKNLMKDTRRAGSEDLWEDDAQADDANPAFSAKPKMTNLDQLLTGAGFDWCSGSIMCDMGYEKFILTGPPLECACGLMRDAVFDMRKNKDSTANGYISRSDPPMQRMFFTKNACLGPHFVAEDKSAYYFPQMCFKGHCVIGRIAKKLDEYLP